MKKNWLIENVAVLIDLIIILVWAGLTCYITGKFLGIIKSQQGVDFSGILGIYAGVTGLATQIVSFHRGSSKGSEDKSKQIDSLMSKPSTIGNIENVDINQKP